MSGLRIIGGKARGRKLLLVPGDTTRPITDKVKKALFDIIGADIQDATLLDLFAGTGGVGIEALSRGAAFVRFVDLNRQPIATLRANLESTGLAGGAQVLRADALAMLQHPAERRFDYVYIAPPQYKQLWSRALQALDAHPDWLSDDAWIIVQIHPVEYEPQDLQTLIEFEQRSYGSTMLVFYETRPKEATDG